MHCKPRDKNMAAMFKKSGRRNFRKKNLDTTEEEDDTNENQPTDNINANAVVKAPDKIKNKAKIEKVASTNSLLSFDDHEGEEEEVFQVRKSKESRKLSKRSKTKKEKLKPRSQEEEEDDNDNRGDSPEKDLSADTRLEALRAELHQMSKLDEDEDEDGEESDDAQEDRDVSLKSGAPLRHQFNIPDAATIHALKKKREMARQLGTGQDFIPLDDTKKFTGRFDSASRLVREDENDASDDEGPISFSAIKTQDNFYRNNEDSENEQGEDDEDEETKRWENEQIRKGVSASQTQQDKEQQSYGVQNYSSSQEHPSSYQPISLFNQNIHPYGGGYSLESTQQQFNGSQHRSVHPKTSKPQVVTMDTVWDSMTKRLESLKEVNRGHCMEQDKIKEHLKVAEESIEKLVQRGVEAERQYGFYQEMRGYVRDLIECLNEKVQAIETSERSMHDLLKQRAQRFVERRQEDVKDQADEFLTMQTGKPKQNTKPIIDEFGRDMSMYVEERKKRRAAEREGRRMRRRRNREVAGTHTAHHEGMSTDDEETETDSRQLISESERILQESRTVFEDVVEDFSSIEKVKSKFEKWKNMCGDSYKNAYISLCLPKLFTVFVRLELLGWNPLLEDALNIEDMSWFNSLVGFGFHDNEEIDAKDDDVKIIPSIIEKAVLSKLIELVQNVWDPMSSKQTERLIKLLKELSDDFPTVQAENKTTQQLFSAIIARMKKAVNDDVYVPLYPKQLLENKASGALEFFQRQYWSCYKLFCNILIWDGLLSSAVIQQLALDGLLNRYLILGLQHSSLHYDSLEKCKLITNTIPRSWLTHLTENTLPTLETFARFLVNLASCLQRSCAGCSDSERKKARSGCKKILQHLVSLKAKNKAKALAAEYGLEEVGINL